MSKRLEDLDVTKEEIEKICESLKDKDFRKLFGEYIDEINDPENQKLYEKEIAQLERDRGVEVTFVHPEAGYVIKTSTDGNKKTFLNICYNDLINKPKCNVSLNENGEKGLRWSIPYTVVQPREDIDKKRQRCDVYDVLFHSQTMHLASRNTRFRDLVNDTACSAVESKYGVQLDRKNLKFPKLRFKGWSRAPVIRKDIPNAPEPSAEDIEFYEKVLPKPEPEPMPKRKPENLPKQDKSPYTIPKYIIKQRRGLNLDEFLDHQTSKLLTSIPTELVVEIELPLLKTSGNMNLDVTEKSVKIICEEPSKYKLSLSLPYPVNENAGSAKFDKEFHKLVIILPVKIDQYRASPPEPVSQEFVNTEDSGVDSDYGGQEVIPEMIYEIISEDDSDSTYKTGDEPYESETLFEDSSTYILPRFTTVRTNNVMLFTLDVKNVEPDSLKYQQKDSIFNLKFTSIGSGYFPQEYGFCLKLDCKFTEVIVEAWDNSVTIQLNITPEVISVYYYVGVNIHSLEEYPMPANDSFNINSDNESDDEEDSNTKDKQSLPTNYQSDDTSPENENHGSNSKLLSSKSQNNRSKIMNRSVSESSSDETTLSPHRRRGILKHGSLSRSVSESSFDDHYNHDRTIGESNSSLDITCESLQRSNVEKSTSVDVAYGNPNRAAVATSTSVDVAYGSLDTCEEKDSSLKKTVRFNDVITQQKFRSQSSILGQKKKNQRKARNKKRAHDRKWSESENSEPEDKPNDGEDEDENKFTSQTISSIIPPKEEIKDNPDHIDFKSDMIFHLDM